MLNWLLKGALQGAAELGKVRRGAVCMVLQDATTFAQRSGSHGGGLADGHARHE